MEPQYKECFIRDRSKPNQLRKLAYMEWGNPNNFPVICVHGLTRNAHDFDYIAPILAQNYWVICPDVMGRGRSDYATYVTDYTYKQYVTDLHSMLKSLGIRETYYIGTSMGGIIAMIFASVFRSTIKKLILNDIGAFIPKKAMDKITAYASHYPSFSTFEEGENYLKEIFGSFGIDSEEKWQHFTKHSLIQNEDGTYRPNYDPAISQTFHSSPNYATDVNLWGFWHLLLKTMPIMILRGEFSNVLSIMTTQQMKMTHPCTELEVKGVGHAPSLMNDDQIMAINDWLLKER
jgi:pimeloyl-ACP methyl ester carboxylesterase